MPKAQFHFSFRRIPILDPFIFLVLCHRCSWVVLFWCFLRALIMAADYFCPDSIPAPASSLVIWGCLLVRWGSTDKIRLIGVYCICISWSPTRERRRHGCHGISASNSSAPRDLWRCGIVGLNFLRCSFCSSRSRVDDDELMLEDLSSCPLGLRLLMRWGHFGICCRCSTIVEHPTGSWIFFRLIDCSKASMS